MNIKVKLMMALFAGMFIAAPAQAHLVSFGWTDNGNGTVTLWGEHWHGDQLGPSTANGGITITDTSNTIAPFTAQWIGHQNNTQRDDMVTNGTLTGYDMGTGNPDSGSNSDWFYTTPLVIGNGTWNFFTGTNCCIDTMRTPVQITLTGITSVPGGTGPGSVNVSAPGALGLLGLGLLGLGFTRLQRKQS